MMQRSILVTGANGFVGRAMVARLRRDGAAVRAAMRTRQAENLNAAEVFCGLDIGGATDWAPALRGVETVIHCAARVHVMRDTGADPLQEFRRVNVQGSVNIATQAIEAGVKRFVFVSSIGVNGAETFDRAFQADDAPAPHSPYAQSKLEAEVALRRLSAQFGIELVIVRPPLVYGPDAPGNFSTLIRAIHRGIPLPFGAVDNLRSLVALDNLVDLLALCGNHPAAAGQIFLVSDGEDVSTPTLLHRIASALGRSARLLPVPVLLLRGAARLLGRAGAAQSLCGSLQVNISKTRKLLRWSPTVGMEAALANTARQYLGQRH